MADYKWHINTRSTKQTSYNYQVFQVPTDFQPITSKMKFLIACALVLVVAAAEDYLVTLDDNFDFTKLSHEELTAVAKCFMNQGPCNELMLSYKQHYPGVVIDACKRCNPAQKKISKVYFGRVQKELPDVYHQLRKHMDPENKYFSNFLASIDLSE